jgi:hypothetical protein
MIASTPSSIVVDRGLPSRCRVFHWSTRAASGFVIAGFLVAMIEHAQAEAFAAMVPSVISEDRWATLVQPLPSPEPIPAPGQQLPLLDPDQPGNVDRSAGEAFLGPTDGPRPVLDPPGSPNSSRKNFPSFV